MTLATFHGKISCMHGTLIALLGFLPSFACVPFGWTKCMYVYMNVCMYVLCMYVFAGEQYAMAAIRIPADRSVG